MDDAGSEVKGRMDLMREVEEEGRAGVVGSHGVARSVRIGVDDNGRLTLRSTLRLAFRSTVEDSGTRGGDWCCAGTKEGMGALARFCEVVLSMRVKSSSRKGL